MHTCTCTSSPFFLLPSSFCRSILSSECILVIHPHTSVSRPKVRSRVVAGFAERRDGRVGCILCGQGIVMGVKAWNLLGSNKDVHSHTTVIISLKQCYIFLEKHSRVLVFRRTFGDSPSPRRHGRDQSGSAGTEIEGRWDLGSDLQVSSWVYCHFEYVWWDQSGVWQQGVSSYEAIATRLFNVVPTPRRIRRLRYRR